MRRNVLAIVLMSATTAWSAPTPASDELEKFLADKGLIGQLQQFGHNAAGRATEMVSQAIGFLGVPYRRGGSSVETGFDCSGFVRAITEQAMGLMLPRRAEQQAAATAKIEPSDLQPGDLVFFNTMRRAFSHVGIYVGNGRFIHSPKPGAEVRVEDMNQAYWARRFDGARRLDSVSLDTRSASD